MFVKFITIAHLISSTPVYLNPSQVNLQLELNNIPFYQNHNIIINITRMYTMTL